MAASLPPPLTRVKQPVSKGMLLTLAPHPDTPCDAVERISVEVIRTTPASLVLRYQVAGDIAQLAVPAWAKPSRADELWRTTCFEAFVREDDEAYYEFNLSPSGQWAAYRFEGYREGMADQQGVETRDLDRSVDGERLMLSVTLDLDRLGLADNRPLCLGLSTVIEETSGRKSYWALAHPSEKPDFHHPDSFVLELP